ncbi:hypothetical protein [Pseudorhodoferax sp.]|uniref:hypothetical protein n=1 Tax=Pseudorhodoferax sp. TaxID=1993553 RepID=UPI002DD683DE|nr:hypothetical protein [Pseudorhodoferax sp.]
MYTQLLSTALIAVSLCAAPAFAQQRGGEVGEFTSPTASTGGLTRAAVHGAVLQARRDGTLSAYGEGTDLAADQLVAGQSLAREQVREALAQALRDGSLPGLGEGDDVGAAPAASGWGGARARDEVRAEAVRALRGGQIPGGEV